MRRKQPLGQNFLVDLHVAKEIVRLAHLDPKGHVVEIGPGKGVLTYDLIPAAGTLTAIEIDPILCHLLRKKFQDKPNFKLLQEDALKLDYGSLASPFQVVSNLPYYAATPILKRLIHFRDSIRDMTLMVQKEVAERLTAQPGTRAYGSLSVMVQFYCQAQALLPVPKSCFHPAPKVESMVIQLVPHKKPPVQVNHLKDFFHLVNAAFFHKRKTLKNNLKSLDKHFAIDLTKIKDAGIDPMRRAEDLALKEFAVISNLLERKQDDG